MPSASSIIPRPHKVRNAGPKPASLTPTDGSGPKPASLTPTDDSGRYSSPRKTTSTPAIDSTLAQQHSWRQQAVKDSQAVVSFAARLATNKNLEMKEGVKLLALDMLSDVQVPTFCSLVEQSFEGIAPAKFEGAVCRITCTMQRHIFHWQITTMKKGKKSQRAFIQLTSHNQGALGALGSKILLMIAVSGAPKEILTKARALFNANPAD